MVSLLKNIRAILIFAFLLIHTLLHSIPLYCIAFLRLVSPRDYFYRYLYWLNIKVGGSWISTNNFAIKHFFRIRTQVRHRDQLSPNNWYLLSSNHQNWFDVLAIFSAVYGKVPFMRYFVKHQIHYLPFIHLSIWSLDCPAMKRHKREDLEKNPELRKIDFNRAKKACENMLLYPSCIMNFTEGTRYTTKKHATQKSPYQHLLKPKPGGLAFAIETLGPKLAGLLDISIIYPKQNLSFWSFLRGDVKSMIIETRVIQIPNKLLNGSYLDDQEYRDNFKAWLDTIWQEKDASIQRGMRELSA